jgi:hypothetical protein
VQGRNRLAECHGSAWDNRVRRGLYALSPQRAPTVSDPLALRATSRPKTIGSWLGKKFGESNVVHGLAHKDKRYKQSSEVEEGRYAAMGKEERPKGRVLLIESRAYRGKGLGQRLRV